MALLSIELPRIKLSTNVLIIWLSVYFTVVFNYPFLKGFMTAITDLAQYKSLFLMSVPVLLCSLMMIVLSLFSIKYIVKPTLITLVLTSSLVLYGSLNYGVVFDYGMIQNTLETSNAEALSYVNIELAVFFTVFGLIPAVLIYRTELTYKGFIHELMQRGKLVSLALFSVLFIAYFFYSNYAAVGRNNQELKRFIVPTQYLSSGYKYARDQMFYQDIEFSILDHKPTLTSKNSNAKKVVVMVLGETARAKSFSHNGYQKPTNSHTQALGLVSFEQMFSCGTATAVSVPCMFSSLTQENFERRDADNQQNLLDLIQLAGVDVLWIDNNGCKGVCARVPTVKVDVNQDSPLCDGQYCQDEALLVPLQDKLNNLNSQTTLIVMHMMGSHGPTYFKRYPDNKKQFTPECARSDIQNCSQEELMNTYDNTIAYTDFVLSEVIASLDNLPGNIEPAMLYVSDHGESLGESGAYLHGLPYALSPVEQRQIPMLVWSPNIAADEKQYQCLQKAAKNNQYSHDNVFHSMLGFMNVQSSAYQQPLDIFSSCPSAPNSQIQLARLGDE